MIDKFVALVAKHAGRERSISIRIVSLTAGIFVFFVVAPIIMGLGSHWIAGFIPLEIPRPIEMWLGLAGLVAGLFFLLWSVTTFWVVGKGTPVPLASPIRLVTRGPFKYTRNPIKLGAILVYFGLGVVGDRLMTGLVMSAIGIGLGTIYHKCVEEKELIVRFGEEYEEYRRRTSFLIPLPPKKNKAARS